LSIARILPPAPSIPTGATSAAKAKQIPQTASKRARKAASKSASSGNAVADVSTSTSLPTKASSSGTILAQPREPWSAQGGGLFVGFLGYWWTIDDGTSASGAREKARLSNLVSAIEEEKDEIPTLNGNEESITPISASHNVNKKQQSCKRAPCKKPRGNTDLWDVSDCCSGTYREHCRRACFYRVKPRDDA
jgi:hypothetical protein